MLRFHGIIAATLLLGTSLHAEAVTITQSTSLTISAGNSTACYSGPNRTAETSYYRVFNLAAAGIQRFVVSGIEVGIESAMGGADQTQPLGIRLYDSGNLAAPGTPVASFNTNVTNQSGGVVYHFPIAASVSSGNLIVEVFSPDGTVAGDGFLIGSNSAGQVAPSYIRAPFCGIATPTNLANVGAPGMHIVMLVTGIASEVSCDIQLSQTTYTTGDVVGATVFRLANSGATAIPIELKTWLGVPSAPSVSLINAGANGSVVLPPGANVNLGPLDLFQVAGTFPRGTYEFSCRILDPTTGSELSASLKPFVIN